MLKAVIDTNVFVNAAITEKGKPAQILKAKEKGEKFLFIKVFKR